MSQPRINETTGGENSHHVAIDVLGQPSGPSALEVSYCQKVRQRAWPVGVSAVHGYAILFIFHYGLDGFSPANQNQDVAIGAGIFAATSWLKDVLGTGKLKSLEDTAKEIVARLFTPFGVVLGGGYLYDNCGPKEWVEGSFLGQGLNSMLGPFGQELGSKVAFVTLLWSLKVLLFKVTGLEKLSYHAKGFGWLQMIAEQTQVWPIQFAFIAIASAFHDAGFSPEDSLAETAACIIALFHVLALLGVEDGLAACFRKGCSAKQSVQGGYVALGDDEGSRHEETRDRDGSLENGTPKEIEDGNKVNNVNSIFSDVATKNENDEMSLMNGKLGGSYGAKGSQ